MAQFTFEDITDRLRVTDGFSLADIDPASTPGIEASSKKKDVDKVIDKLFDDYDNELAALQEKLFANGRADVANTGAVLLVLQGMDTSGKGGVIRKVFEVFDPQGIDSVGFGKPTEEERKHDFLWRIRPHVPEPGYIQVFDRSHYEDVLVQRVHDMAPADEIERRYGAIVDFEKELTDRNVKVIKVMLHISKEFQKENLTERLENPEKHWKYNPGDIDERGHWDEYQEAYEIAMQRTSTEDAPWYCIPSDNKPYARLVVKHLLLDALRSLNLSWPEATFDVEAEKKRLEQA
ncbi:PPK2 family polyphosphate kinase [Corynebacterium sp. H113]|uniref:PPK2 family polyphosphate kinase n=1 Tax=Corynebacterium sp. H113 TaxID=3133419 RepID=UPI0030AC7FB2